jgi:dynamin 1-like protein
MTRVPVGDQPPDIEVQIRDMILSFIKKPTSIILAVTAANTDLTNSDALNLARMVDPEGNRTIGVLTKIDIMDKGTNAMDALLNKVVPLQMGYVGIINRSQEDITRKVPIRDALRTEAAFFKNHALYRSISTRCGTQYLSKSLNKILMHHIRDSLPELKSKINKMLGRGADRDGRLRRRALRLARLARRAAPPDHHQVLQQLCRRHRRQPHHAVSTTELYGGARINFIFNEIFGACLARVDPLAGLSLADVKTTIRNATGPKAALFVPESSFELLVKRQIARLQDPSLACVDLVYDELQRIVSQIETKELARFGHLRQQVVDVVGQLLHNLVEPTKRMIADLVAIELAFINTSHPDFIGGDGALSNILEKMVDEKLAQQQKEQQRQQRRRRRSRRAPPSAPLPPARSSSRRSARTASRCRPPPPPPGAAAPASAERHRPAPRHRLHVDAVWRRGAQGRLRGGAVVGGGVVVVVVGAGGDKNAPVTLAPVPAQIKASADVQRPERVVRDAADSESADVLL